MNNLFDTPEVEAEATRRDTVPVDAALLDGFSRNLRHQNYLFINGSMMHDLLHVHLNDAQDFGAYWPRLTLDRHMGDGGTYRFRRYGQFDSIPGQPRQLLPHAPYEQPKYINSLNGGVARVFDPLEPGFITHPVLQRLLNWLTELYNQCEGHPHRWNIRLHPYRVLARPNEPGHPSPEGLHRDGVDYIVSMMVARSNVVGGESTITDNERQVLWSRAMQQPFDIMIGRDAHVMHGVTSVQPIDSGRDAYRDVLVVAFTKVTE